MPTIGWNDIAFGDAPGQIRFREFLVSITAEHIARWKDDPDGRYRLKLLSETARTAEPEKFYPSL